jgi:hypothetical protein
MTDLAEPEDLLSRFGVTFIADPDVQSLVDPDGTWLVPWIGRHRAMTHLHELDLLELRQFLRVGGDLARGRGRGSVARRRGGGDTRKVFGEQGVGGLVLGRCEGFGRRTCVL